MNRRNFLRAVPLTLAALGASSAVMAESLSDKNTDLVFYPYTDETAAALNATGNIFAVIVMGDDDVVQAQKDVLAQVYNRNPNLHMPTLLIEYEDVSSYGEAERWYVNTPGTMVFLRSGEMVGRDETPPSVEGLEIFYQAVAVPLDEEGQG